MVTIEDLQEIAIVYSKLEIDLLKSLEGSNGERKLFIGHAIFFATAFHNQYLLAFMIEVSNHPDIITRFWANWGVNDFNRMHRSHLIDDGTAWN